MSRFEVVEVVLVQCNLIENQYQQNSEVLYTFTPKKAYAYMLNFFIFIFFLSGFSFTTIRESQDCRGRGVSL